MMPVIPVVGKPLGKIALTRVIALALIAVTQGQLGHRDSET
jgi:hypothetical protein